MDWSTEQQAQRREWGLDRLEQEPLFLSTVDPMDAYLREHNRVREDQVLAHHQDVDQGA